MSVTRMAAASLVLSILGASAMATDNSGYLIDSRGIVVKNSTGLCWKTGYWTPAMATEECDPDLVQKQKPSAPTVAAKQTPRPIAPPMKSESLSLSADGLFTFGRATLVPASREKLDALAAKLHAGNYSRIEIVGHTDRLGTAKGNLKLSKERAEAVKAFLVAHGIDGTRVLTSGRGSADPKTRPSECTGKKSPRLIACLQPDRRVEITVKP